MADSKKPDYDVMISKSVVKDGDSKNIYTNIGAAWKVSKDGISISLDCIPIEGKMVLFPRTEKTASRKTDEVATTS